MNLLETYHNWLSAEEVEVLNHDLNYSRWTDTYPCKGKWKIEISDIETAIEKISVYMPASEWGSVQYGYWKIYSGRMEIKEDVLLIWQNKAAPVQLSYSEINSTVNLCIYGRTITFERA